MSGRVEVKPETRNHKGFFVQDTDYELVGIEGSGWALIIMLTQIIYSNRGAE